VLLRGEVTRRHPVFGDSDPLSDDLAKAVDTETLVQAEFQRSPLDGATPLERAWPYSSAMPGKQLARRIRDARLLREARGEDIEQELEEYVSRRHAAEDRQQLAAAAAAGKGSQTS